MDIDIDESDLRVRWEKAPKNPLQVLLTGANETPRYRDVREPVRRLLIAERAATGSATGIASSGVQMHAHQINAALRIIRDPIQRYLLADEVGMGKTIQAGLVMRQILHDSPGRRVGVVVPDALKGQWRAELRDKFHLGDFPTHDGEDPVRILGHSQVDDWDAFGDLDLLVVDEAHLLARASSPT
ncbi:MAG: restriction endonuclease subunit R, partial [Comamonadaceae bacterium]